jgi:4,5-DOPA dioxygenase extradiol
LAPYIPALKRRGFTARKDNLGLLDSGDIDAKPFNWSVEFDEQVKANLLGRNHRDLVHYPNMGRTSSLAVPTLDHYLPMIYVIALREKNEPLTFIHEGFQYGSISMRCFHIG